MPALTLLWGNLAESLALNKAHLITISISHFNARHCEIFLPAFWSQIGSERYVLPLQLLQEWRRQSVANPTERLFEIESVQNTRMTGTCDNKQLFFWLVTLVLVHSAPPLCCFFVFLEGSYSLLIVMRFTQRLLMKLLYTLFVFTNTLNLIQFRFCH